MQKESHSQNDSHGIVKNTQPQRAAKILGKSMEMGKNEEFRVVNTIYHVDSYQKCFGFFLVAVFWLIITVD